MNVDYNLYCTKKENIKKKKLENYFFLMTKYRENRGVVETKWLYTTQCFEDKYQNNSSTMFWNLFKMSTSYRHQF